MSLPHALLGMLVVQPRSGYELTRSFEDTIGRWAWSAGHTAIYPELARLRDAGLIEVTATGPRNSRTYAATAAGRAELKRWMVHEPQRKVRHEYILRMFLISALDGGDAVEYLTHVIRHTEEMAAELREQRAAGPVDAGSRSTFGALAAEFGARQLEMNRSWAEWAIETLRRTGAVSDERPSAAEPG
jgi:DNA-binding PadR family transcriptional regulator